MMMPQDRLEAAAERMLIAQTAFAKISSEEPRDGAPMMQKAGCGRACHPCWLECSIVHMSMEHAEGEYRAALAASSGALIHEGRHFSDFAGRA